MADCTNSQFQRKASFRCDTLFSSEYSLYLFKLYDRPFEEHSSDHTSSRFTDKRDVILTQGDLRGGGEGRPIKDRAGCINKSG